MTTEREPRPGEETQQGPGTKETHAETETAGAPREEGNGAPQRDSDTGGAGDPKGAAAAAPDQPGPDAIPMTVAYADPKGVSERDPGCQCDITPEMIWAGPGIQLCQHSSAAAAQMVQEKLMDLMGYFAQNIDPSKMFDKTIIQLAEDYRQQAAGRFNRLLNEEEINIINIQFMRNLSLAAQMIGCTMIIRRRENLTG